MQVLGLAGAGAAVAGLPVAAKAAQRTERFVGTPGETYMIPTVETVQGFIDANSVADVLGDTSRIAFEQEVPDIGHLYKITHKNVADIHRFNAEVKGHKPVMVFIGSESQSPSSSGFFKTLAMSFPEMAKLYVDIDINGKINHEMGNWAASYFANESSPAIVFFDKSGNRLPQYHKNDFKTHKSFYTSVDYFLPFVAERVLGGKYADRAIRIMSILDYYGVGSPVDPKQGYPKEARFKPSAKRGTLGKGTKVKTLSGKKDALEWTNPGEFTSEYQGSKYGEKIRPVLAAHGISENHLNTLLSNINEIGVIIYDCGMMRIKDGKSNGSYIFPMHQKACNPLRVAYGMKPLG